MPELSIITSSYNDGELSLASAKSVFSQSGELPDLELIVVDDGSTDPLSITTLDNLPALDPRVRLIRLDRNMGISCARNHGVSQARGEWIIFLDADDEWFPDSLHRIWKALKSNPDHKWIGGDWARWRDGVLLDPDGAALTREVFSSELLRHACRDNKPIARIERPTEACIRGGLTMPSSCFIRKELFLATGRFVERLRYAEDMHLFCRMAPETDFYFVPILFHRYRQWKKKDRGRMGSEGYWTAEALRSLKSDPRFKKYRQLIDQEVVTYLRDDIYGYRKKRKLYMALKAALILIRAKPDDPVGWKSIPAALLGR